MIEFKKKKLDNGLTIIVNEDKSTPIVAFNLLYNVGARDEEINKTGFAHLFEHLMFGGSKNIPNYDQVIQSVGGSNNAFTTNDITNYYLTLPLNNIETAFWTESDRMNQLDFSQKTLDVQKNVVIEEFKQRYLNQPYGDEMLLMRPLCYKEHPYKWPTIGKEIKHIEDANLDDVKDFFYTHYGPQNAVLAISGDINVDDVEKLSNKWFGDIPNRSGYVRSIPKEPKQMERRELEVERDVPVDSIMLAFHMEPRANDKYFATDLLSDILSRGSSTRLNQNLMKKKKLFSEINAYVTGNIDAGLFIVSGKLIPKVSMKQAEEAIWEELHRLKTELVPEEELQKAKNKIESTTVFQEMNVLNKATNLAFYELIDDASLVNEEVKRYQKVSVEQLKQAAIEVFTEENSNVLKYYAKK